MVVSLSKPLTGELSVFISLGEVVPWRYYVMSVPVNGADAHMKGPVNGADAHMKGLCIAVQIVGL